MAPRKRRRDGSTSEGGLGRGRPFMGTSLQILMRLPVGDSVRLLKYKP